MGWMWIALLIEAVGLTASLAVAASSATDMPSVSDPSVRIAA
jgi:hypothetical protein